MHDSVRRFGELMLPFHKVHDKTVIEAGGLDVNGSLRPWCESQGCRSYLSTDMRAGPGVDEVCPAEDVYTFGQHDIVICTEMLEHAYTWREALHGVKRAVAPGGLLILTTRSPGFGRHEHPHDHWRFTIPQIVHAMQGFNALGVVDDPDAPGVLYAGRRIANASPVDIMVPEFEVEAAPA